MHWLVDSFIIVFGCFEILFYQYERDDVDDIKWEVPEIILDGRKLLRQFNCGNSFRNDSFRPQQTLLGYRGHCNLVEEISTNLCGFWLWLSGTVVEWFFECCQTDKYAYYSKVCETRQFYIDRPLCALLFPWLTGISPQHCQPFSWIPGSGHRCAHKHSRRGIGNAKNRLRKFRGIPLKHLKPVQEAYTPAKCFQPFGPDNVLNIWSFEFRI